MRGDDQLRDLLQRGEDEVARAQAAFAARVEDRDWEVDVERGELTFDDGQVLGVEVLGTESTETFMWAWANPHVAGLAAARGSERLRACGEEHGIEALTAGRVPLAAMDAHTAGAVGLLVTGAGACFAGAHEGGRIALLVGCA